MKIYVFNFSMHVQAAYINDKIPMINEGLCIRFFHVCAGGVGAGRRRGKGLVNVRE